MSSSKDKDECGQMVCDNTRLCTTGRFGSVTFRHRRVDSRPRLCLRSVGLLTPDLRVHYDQKIWLVYI